MAESKNPDLLDGILNRIVGAVRKEMAPPRINVLSVERYARRMTALGYDFSKETLGILVDYLKGYNMYICGRVGVGKTFFFETMSKIRVVDGYSPLVKLSMLETQGWTMEDAKAWVMDNSDSDVVIDDVGTEPVMHSYGQEAELFPYLLEKRMQLVARRTHMTSNLGMTDIKKRYGVRVGDRCIQFFKQDVISTKTSRRKLRPWKSCKGDCVV